jgi:hypothetical protein
MKGRRNFHKAFYFPCLHLLEEGGKFQASLFFKLFQWGNKASFLPFMLLKGGMENSKAMEKGRNSFS